MSKLQEIIKGRTVGFMLHGQSIKELEDHIVELKDADICWVSTSLFPIMEKYILSKIDKNLDIVFDCATVPHSRLEHYENIRLPRLEEFLERPVNNLWITTHGLMRDSVYPFAPWLSGWYFEKILLVDSLFPPNNIPYWMDVPNSTALAIGAIIAGGAKRIITFGLDGYKGDITTGVNSYYQPNEHRKERLAALGTEQDPGINRDTAGFETRFTQRLVEYKELFGNDCEIVNCSPNSLYNMIPKISYSELRGKC